MKSNKKCILFVLPSKHKKKTKRKKQFVLQMSGLEQQGLVNLIIDVNQVFSCFGWLSA